MGRDDLSLKLPTLLILLPTKEEDLDQNMPDTNAREIEKMPDTKTR